MQKKFKKDLRKDLDFFAQQELFWIAERLPGLAEALLSEKGLDSATLDEAIKDMCDFYEGFIEKYLKERVEEDENKK